ncbi:hypothetical protein AYI70_g7643 [Smittium culicis]|uniref:Endonuclease/exonuclease/phosphatase domain-containing protein n=1 Tax=Smittium culicis TaxID=133412 RepID=A0A1R1XJQ3_9FUNG|nr:hypothetical protein AYI70_g7643 [Smittium culicis]
MNNFRNIRIGYWNCQWLSDRKWVSALAAVKEAKLDILFLAETWFLDHETHVSHPDYLVSTPRILPKPVIGHEQAGIVCIVSQDI